MVARTDGATRLILKRLPPELRNLERDLAGAGMKPSVIASRPGILARLRAFVATGIAQPLRFGVQKRVQRILHSPSKIFPR